MPAWTCRSLSACIVGPFVRTWEVVESCSLCGWAACYEEQLSKSGPSPNSMASAFSAVQDACFGVVLEFLDDGSWSAAFSALSATSKKLDAAISNFCQYRLRVMNARPGNDWILAAIKSSNLSSKKGKALWQRPRSLLIDVVADLRRPLWCIAASAESHKNDFVFRRAPLCSFKRTHTHRALFHRGQWFVIGDSRVEVLTPCPSSALGFRVTEGPDLPVANLVSFALVSLGRDLLVLGGVDDKMVGSSKVFRLRRFEAEAEAEAEGGARKLEWEEYPKMSPLPPWVSAINQHAALCPLLNRLYVLGGKVIAYASHEGGGACKFVRGRCSECGADEPPHKSGAVNCSYFDVSLGQWFPCPPLDIISWSYAFPWKVFVRDGTLLAVALDSSDVIVARLEAGAEAWQVKMKMRGGDFRWKGIGAVRWSEREVLFLDKEGSVAVDADADPLPFLRRRPYSECTMAPLRSWHTGMGTDETSPFLARSATDPSRAAADSSVF